MQAPTPQLAASVKRASGSSCPASLFRRTTSGNLHICVGVPGSEGSLELAVTDSLYGTAGIQTLKKRPSASSSNCAYVSGEYECGFSFVAPPGINQVEVDADYGTSQIAGGTFPVSIASKGTASASAVLGGTITAVAIVPFLSTNLSSNQSYLPVGYQQGTGEQSEGVWVEAFDGQSVVIGSYGSPGITITASGNLTPSQSTLTSSEQAEKLTVAWTNAELQSGSSSGEGMLTATYGSVPPGTADIDPSSGVVYFTPGPSNVPVSGGPVVVGPDNNVYFAINDDKCTKKGSCRGGIYQFDTTSLTVNPSFVALPDAPGVSQLYVTGGTSDAELWIATFQPNGNWTGDLPSYRLSLQKFPGTLAPLSLTHFSNASGFVADETANEIYVSRCAGTGCRQDHNGTPMVAESTISSPRYVGAVSLPNCASFGYLGFTVGDVALFNKKLYVIGLNDGSAPPAHGTIWQVPLPLGTKGTKCLAGVPKNFNPSPYFAQVGTRLLGGIGGNSYNVRWGPSNGFYAITSSGVMPSPDPTPLGSPTHISAFTGSGLLYYIAENGVRSLRLYGLGTFEPEVSGTGSQAKLLGRWNVFPNAAFSGQEFNNGVAAVSNGAWFTATSVCGNWAGVCLGRARYYSAWGTLPTLNLGTLTNGQTTNLGIVNPLNVRGGPFIAVQGANESNTCSVAPLATPSPLTFVVTAKSSPGPCLVKLYQQGASRVQYLVTSVKGKAKPSR
jgi:hypothetical protein